VVKTPALLIHAKCYGIFYSYYFNENLKTTIPVKITTEQKQLENVEYF